MLVSYRCNRCGKPSIVGPCVCGGLIEAVPQQYRGPLILREVFEPKPLMSLEQELAEIRARHVRRREYNRVANAAKRLRQRISHATVSHHDMDQSDH